MFKGMLGAFFAVFVLNAMISFGIESWDFFVTNNVFIVIGFIISATIVGIIEKRRYEEQEASRKNHGVYVYRSRR